MEKLFHFDSLEEPYVADAVVLCCFDHRVSLATRKFLKWRGILCPDMVVVAGGARTLATPRNDFERDFLMEQFRMSILLHQAPRVILMSHSDCATYGGLAQFKGDRDAEAEYHHKELALAAGLVRSAFPQVEIECCFVNFEGVWKDDSVASPEAPTAA
jgi:carbonic anhydrase